MTIFLSDSNSDPPCTTMSYNFAKLTHLFPLRYIKMSSPHLNNLIIIGCMLTYMSVIFLGLDSGLSSVAAFPYICTARAWLLMAGFSLAFGAMFSKTWRVHSIFTDLKLNKKVIKDYQLFIVVGVLLAIDLAIMTTWQIADPFYRETKHIEPSVGFDFFLVSIFHILSQTGSPNIGRRYHRSGERILSIQQDDHFHRYNIRVQRFAANIWSISGVGDSTCIHPRFERLQARGTFRLQLRNHVRYGCCNCLSSVRPQRRRIYSNIALHNLLYDSHPLLGVCSEGEIFR